MDMKEIEETIYYRQGDGRGMRYMMTLLTISLWWPGIPQDELLHHLRPGAQHHLHRPALSAPQLPQDHGELAGGDHPTTELHGTARHRHRLHRHRARQHQSAALNKRK